MPDMDACFSIAIIRRSDILEAYDELEEGYEEVKKIIENMSDEDMEDGIIEYIQEDRFPNFHASLRCAFENTIMNRKYKKGALELILKKAIAKEQDKNIPDLPE